MSATVWTTKQVGEVVDSIATSIEEELSLGGDPKSAAHHAVSVLSVDGYLPSPQVCELSRKLSRKLDGDTQRVIDLALRKALLLGHSQIAPVHILLAIVCDGQSDAAAVLIDLAGSGKAARQAVFDRIAGGAR